MKVAIETIDRDKINVVGNYSPSGHDASRIAHPQGIAPTVKENHGTVTATLQEPFIVASRGRNPENPSDRTAGIKTEQRLEPNTRGVCNTLTSVQKDNYVAEPVNTDVKPTLVGGIGEKNFGTQYRQGNRVYDAESVGMALQSNPVGNAGGNSYLYKHNYRIRKLTPKECWRLMGFSDEDFAKAESVNSNTQLYKQAGNSIVVNVLMAIFWELLL